jgi:hypothetical protein
MIKNAVIHLNNEQPLLADLFAMPEATDIALPCTNLRTMSGERPLFADHVGSFFLFPLAYIRFVEIASTGPQEPTRRDSLESAAAETVLAPAGEEELTIDEDFLRRVREA